MTPDLVPRLYQESLNVPYVFMDDVYITGLVASRLKHPPVFYRKLSVGSTLSRSIWRSRLQANCLALNIVSSICIYCLVSIVYCLVSIVYCLVSIVYCLVSSVQYLFSSVYCLISSVFVQYLVSIVYCLVPGAWCLVPSQLMYQLPQTS